MNIVNLIARSKQVDNSDALTITSLQSDEPLVVVTESSKIILEPIWINQIDDIEGPLYAKYIDKNPAYNKIYVRGQVLKRLQKVSEALPKHLALVVRAGHRPAEVQLQLLKSLVEKYQTENPGCAQQKALEFARTFVSDPEITLPPHCCGAAVDVDIFNTKTQRLLDFGCPVNTDSETAFLHTNNITTTQSNNRLLLLGTMLQAGFASHSNEWWHYSYGDQIWANFYNQNESIYGIIEPEL